MLSLINHTWIKINLLYSKSKCDFEDILDPLVSWNDLDNQALVSVRQQLVATSFLP